VQPTSVYIHVPFCVRRCAYCDFAVEAVREPPVAEWLDAVAHELELLVGAQAWDGLHLSTIYVGGGTPSLLGPGAMAALADRLARFASWDAARVEWTCEANPESFDARLAADWRAAGVNRLSLGVQSFDDAVLRWMGRLHGPDGAARAMGAAREAGIDNVSVDLIFALPERLDRDWARDLDHALALEPEHVSLYGLTAEPATPLGRWVREGRERMMGEDRYAEEYLLAHHRLGAAGFEHYEVSNFARPGRASRHNGVYWTGTPYIALGPGAHAYYPPERRWNLRGWGAYREALSRNELPVEGREVVSAGDAALEQLWLALRTRAGMPFAAMAPVQRQLAERWVERGWAEPGQARLRLNADGWLLLDRLAVELSAAGDAVTG
jgi:oxygen-independent coproporphyrinogen III oxidase